MFLVEEKKFVLYACTYNLNIKSENKNHSQNTLVLWVKQSLLIIRIKIFYHIKILK